MITLLPSPVAAARCYAILMCAAAGFQLLLVLGAPWGEFTQGGTNTGPLPLPMRLIAAASTAILLVFAAGVLALHAEGPLRSASPRLLRLLRRITVAYACVAVILNLLTESVLERAVWAPFSIVVLVLLLRARYTAPSEGHPIQ